MDAYLPEKGVSFASRNTFNGNMTAGLSTHGWYLSTTVRMYSKMSNTEYYTGSISDVVQNYRSLGISAYEKRHTEFYSNWSLSAAKRIKGVMTTVGVRNLFDEEPPTVSVGSGGWAGSRNGGTVSPISQFDLLGRTFFASLEKKF